MPRLTGRLCLVTGAARGIGKAIAHLFVMEGATVALTDIGEVSGRTSAGAIGAEFRKLDVASENDWLNIASVFPSIDVLVNHAAITGLENGPVAHDPENATLSDWRLVHEVNLDGTFLGCRYAIRVMRERGEGSIIIISSCSGMVGIPMASAYASSKAAIRNHTKTVALNCAGQGLNIRCNSIHPAAILTPMWEPMHGNGTDREERTAALVAEASLKHFGRSDEVAALAVLLASDETTYMTGAELTIDGGILAGSSAAPG